METATLKGAVALGTAVLLAVPCVALPQPDAGGAYQIGVATWYGQQFQGRDTASGEAFDMFRLTAAHRDLPLGSYVRVTNLKNHKWAVIRINDRGPLLPSIIIDLSEAAAELLGIKQQGRALVRLDPVAIPELEDGVPERD